MPYVNIPNSELAPLVGRLVGRIKAKVRTEVDTKVKELLDEFTDSVICENELRLENIVATKNRISKVLIGFKKRIEKIRKISEPLLIAVTSFRAVITIIKLLPTPTTPAVTTGSIISLSDKLEVAKEYVRQIEEDVTTINNLILGATGIFILIESVLSKLDIIEFEIRKCRGEVDSTKTVDDIISAQNLDQSSDPNQVSIFTSTTGRVFKLEIKIESRDMLAPLKIAIARDFNSDRIVLTGEKSYSSSNEILLEELKFRIETELT